MEQNQNAFAGASTEEALLSQVEGRASPFTPSHRSEAGHPVFASPEAEQLYWRAYMDGVRAAGREPGHPHMPDGFDLDLTRDPASPSLVSSKLIETWPEAVPVPGDGSVETGYGGSAPPETILPDPGRCQAQPDGGAGTASDRTRHDGWTGARRRRFLDMLAQTGVVADACRAVGISRHSAYALRNRAGGRAFALAWDGAILISRGAIADDVMSRARHGCVDRVYRNGELVAERHRYDNRLTMAVLTRLDRLADGLGENAPVVRAVAQEWDQFLDIVEAGGEDADDFLRSRAEPAAPSPLHAEAGLLGRLAGYRRYGAGLPGETDVGDLYTCEMEAWTDDQWARAERSGLLDSLRPEDWPEAARAPLAECSDPDCTEPLPGEDAAAHGMCKLRKLYLERHPERPPEEGEAEDDFEGRSVWKDEQDGWITDFPPPEGFDGWEEGEPGDDDYRRSLSCEEEDAVHAADHESEPEEERAARLAAEHAARNRFFGFDAPPSQEEFPGISPPSFEGGAGGGPRPRGLDAPEDASLQQPE
jgi:hypothetical protein